MFTPAVVGFLTSILFLKGLVLSGSQMTDLASANFNKGLETVQEINHLPINAYRLFNPDNHLPLNYEKPIPPTKKEGAPELSVSASSCALLDKASGEIVYSANADEVRPIASITKLMTALVWLSIDNDFEKNYTLKKEDVRLGGKSYIYPGDEMKTKDLFNLALVASDNTAIVGLISSTGLSEKDFVVKMNERAKEMGLTKTYFEDATGLSDKNVSTASEALILAKNSFKMNKIKETVTKKDYEFTTVGGRKVKAVPTDMLLEKSPTDGITIIGGKTGHTNEAGYCFVSQFKNSAGNEVISSVLGTKSEDARFTETKKMVEWVYNNFIWPAATY